MSEPKRQRIGDLEIDQDLVVQERSWTFQRIGWAVIALILGLALAGSFGRGPLAEKQAGDPASLLIDYGRFERRTEPATFTLHLGPALVTPNGVQTVRLWIHRDFLQMHRLERIEPEPLGAVMTADRMIIDLAVSGQRPEVLIRYETEGFGPSTTRLGVLGGPEVSLWQFIYP